MKKDRTINKIKLNSNLMDILKYRIGKFFTRMELITICDLAVYNIHNIKTHEYIINYRPEISIGKYILCGNKDKIYSIPKIFKPNDGYLFPSLESSKTLHGIRIKSSKKELKIELYLDLKNEGLDKITKITPIHLQSSDERYYESIFQYV